MSSKLTHLITDDWEALYVGGLLQTEGHTIEVASFADFVPIVEFESRWARPALKNHVNDTGAFPRNLADALRIEEAGRDVLKEINAFIDKWPSSQWGDAHIVIGDLNTDDLNIRHCIVSLMRSLLKKPGDTELFATAEFLVSLLEIPEKDREARL